MPNRIGWGRIFLSVFVLMLLWFYISWKSFKSGNTVNTEYINRIPNPESLTGANVPLLQKDPKNPCIMGQNQNWPISHD